MTNIEILACVSCGNPVRALAWHLQCTQCHAEYPIVEGVPIFAERLHDSSKLEQQEMWDQKSEGISDVEDIKALVYGADYLGGASSLNQRRARKLIEETFAGCSGAILDIGCSTGKRMRWLSHMYSTGVAGVDISLDSLLAAKKKDVFENTFHLADAENLPFQDGSFHAITCNSVLEHLPHPEKAVSEISRILRRDGILWVCMPVRDIKFTRDWISRQLFPKLWERKQKLAGHDHTRMLSGQELCDLVQNNGFTIKRIERSDVLLQNIYDYIITPLLISMLKRFYPRSQAKMPVEHSSCRTDNHGHRMMKLAWKIYCHVLLPVVEFLCLPDRILARFGVGASVSVVARKRNCHDTPVT